MNYTIGSDRGANLGDLTNRAMHSYVWDTVWERDYCTDIKEKLELIMPPGQKWHFNIRLRDKTKGEKQDENAA